MSRQDLLTRRSRLRTRCSNGGTLLSIGSSDHRPAVNRGSVEGRRGVLSACRRVTQPDTWTGQPPTFQARREPWPPPKSCCCSRARVARRCLKWHHHRSSCPERLWSLPQDQHAPHCSPPSSAVRSGQRRHPAVFSTGCQAPSTCTGALRLML